MSGQERLDIKLANDWRDEALCAEVDGDLMFPEKGDQLGLQLAKRVCANCVVVDDCLADAIEHPPLHGIRAGKTARALRDMRSQTNHLAVHEEQRREHYEQARALRASGVSLQAIARRLGYASHGGVSALLNSYPNEDAAS